MWDFIGLLVTVIVILSLLELLALPDWIRRKLRGGMDHQEIRRRLEDLEAGLSALEQKLAR